VLRIFVNVDASGYRYKTCLQIAHLLSAVKPDYDIHKST